MSFLKEKKKQLIFSRLEDTLWDADSFWAAVGLYLVWQIGYWVITEVIHHFWITSIAIISGSHSVRSLFLANWTQLTNEKT